MKAAVQGDGVVQVEERPKPSIEKGQVLVKVAAIGLNPTDWKHAFREKYPGAISGLDFAGRVEEVGEGVSGWSKGDRIAGGDHGGGPFPSRGAFAEYVAADAALAMHIPLAVKDEEAACFWCSVTTVGQGLYQSLQLPTPDAPATDRTPLLIWAGSTGTGVLAIQYARVSGLEVITTCSPKHFDYLKTLGASHTFDYNDPDVAAKIKKVSGNKLKYAFDCIAQGDSTKLCAESMSDEGGVYSSLLPVNTEGLRQDVEYKRTLAYTAFGRAIKAKSWEMPARPEDHRFAARFWKISETLFDSGVIKTWKTRVIPGGLAGVQKGLVELQEGKVSGEKLALIL